MKVLLPEVLLPDVAVRVELHECERPVLARERAQLGERDRMVAAERRDEDARATIGASASSTCAYVRSVSPGETGRSP